MAITKIEWADAVWNLVTGCTPAGAGCANCYARRMFRRLSGISPKYRGRQFDDVQCHEDELSVPLQWKEPRAIFVASMGDLFHHDVPYCFVSNAFESMESCPQHTFIVLTKRIGRARSITHMRNAMFDRIPPNMILGVSVSNQEEANRDIPILTSIDGVRRAVSCEPLLGSIDLLYAAFTGAESLNRMGGIDWVICGGESGPGARPMRADWARAIRDDCKRSRVPFFFKQWGEFDERGARVGKKKAGRLLDGVEHNGKPE